MPIAPAPAVTAAGACWRRWRYAPCKPLNAWLTLSRPVSATRFSMKDRPIMTTGPMTSTRSLAHIALFAAVIAVFGLIPRVELPFGVPITLQTLGIMLVGCLLGPKHAF